MFDKLKELLLNWKVSVALVGGALVVATIFGTCTFSPSQDDVSDEDVEAEVTAPSDVEAEETPEAE